MKRIFGSFVAIAMVLTLVGSSVAPAQAVTIEELQAMIASLTAQLAALTGGSTSTGYMFNTNLTIGSTGNDVVQLQTMLVSKGHLVMPAGVAMGYFGSLTQAAVAAWQAANGISPAAGYFGPISRAKANTTVVVTPPVTPGTTTGITTPGVEGTITASVNPTPGAGTKVYEGDSRKVVMGIKLEAKLSDIKIERVKLDLDAVTVNNDNDFYDDIASRIYIMDGSTVLASMDLNSSTVVKDGSDYFVTVAGMSFIVPKGTIKVLDVAIDAQANFDSTFNTDSWTVGIPVDGVRGIDGAGISQYSPSTAFTRSFTSEADLSDSATLQISTNTGTVKANTVIAAQGSSENEYDGLEILKFDAKAEDDDVTITDLVVDITRGGVTTTATATTAYVYDGSTLVGSATVVGTSATVMTATFTDIDYVVPMDTTKVFTVKLDIDSAAAAAVTFLVDIDTADVTAENSAGDAITESGSATGNTLTIHSKGPQFTLVSKSISKSSTPNQAASSTDSSLGTIATSTMTASFSVKVKAVGGDVTFGGVASATPSFGSSTTYFQVYQNGAALGGSSLLVASSTAYSTPSSGVVTSGIGTNSFKLQENNEVTIDVSFLAEGRTKAGVLVTTGSYAIGLEGITWSVDDGASTVTTSFMDGDLDWRTSTVSMP